MNLNLKRSFITWEHSSPFTVRETRTPFSTLVKDLVSLALTEKRVHLKICSSFPRLILPNNMRGRTVIVSKVFQSIGTFRKGVFKELWNMPNVVLRYGSFNPVKRAEALLEQVS